MRGAIRRGTPRGRGMQPGPAVSASTEPARPRSRAELRRFGLTVGIAFGALAAIFWWRGHAPPATVLALLGVGLVGGGLAAPSALRPVERGWMTLARAISRITTPIVMTLLYFGVLLPTGLLRRALGGDPLRHDPDEQGYWADRGERRRSDLRRQF